MFLGEPRDLFRAEVSRQGASRKRQESFRETSQEHESFVKLQQPPSLRLSKSVAIVVCCVLFSPLCRALSGAFGRSFPRRKVTRKSAQTAGTRCHQLSRSLPLPFLSLTPGRGLKYRRYQPRLNNSARKFQPRKLSWVRRESQASVAGDCLKTIEIRFVLQD